MSLKNIEEDKAEFAITVRKYAMGKGYSRFGMREIIRMGLEDMNLSRIYWYVDKNNQRAIKFYDKNGYQRIFPEIIGVETKPIFGLKKQNNEYVGGVRPYKMQGGY